MPEYWLIDRDRRALEASGHDSVLYLAARVLLHAGDAEGMEAVAVRLEDLQRDLERIADDLMVDVDLEEPE